MIAARQIAFGRGGKRKPYDAEVEYLESTGTQYIDTGVILKSYYKYEVTFSCVSTNTGSKMLFGMYSLRSRDGTQALKDNFSVNCPGSWGVNNPKIAIYSYPNNGIADSSSPNAVQVASRTVAVRYGEPNTVSHDSGVTYFNGEEIINRPSSMPNNPYNIPSYLFANAVRQQDRSVKPGYFFIGRIMSAKIKDASGNLLRDFIPVRKKDVGYMYDRVSGQLFGNQGTGGFTWDELDAVSANGGGYSRRCIRRSYRRSWRASTRFSPRHLWKEVA